MEEGSCQIQGFKYNRKTQERQSSGGLMVNSSGGLWALREWQVKKVLPKGISEGCEDLSCKCTLSQSAEDPFLFVSQVPGKLSCPQAGWQKGHALIYLNGSCLRRGRK